MSVGRERVFGAVRAAIGAMADDKSRREAVQQRLADHPANLVPEQARRGAKERLDLFVDTLKSQAAEVKRVKEPAEIPALIAGYLREHNLPARLRMGDDPLLNSLPWDRAKGMDVLRGRGEAGDVVTLSRATVGAGETGTLFLSSGKDNPTTLNFLPETHIVVIEADKVVGSYEDAWNRLREVYGQGQMPRTVNMISGPSRTADIEQTIVMGAHGPRALMVVVVG